MMAYYNELPKDLQDDLWWELVDIIEADPAHRENAKIAGSHLTRYSGEVADNWFNCHNFDLSNAEWIKQVKEADV